MQNVWKGESSTLSEVPQGFFLNASELAHHTDLKIIFMIRFGFCDILNNQGLGKCYQPQPSAQLITLTSTLII